MNTDTQHLREGHFAKKQIFSKDWLISWSHRRRFEVGMRLAKEFNGRRVLDYGCGDGSFLAMLMNSPNAPKTAIGVEVDVRLVGECNTRFAKQSGLRFLHSSQLNNSEHKQAYHAVFCMEVLEHIVDIGPALEKLDCLLSSDGKLVISVPVETGLPLLVKQCARRVAGWRGIGDYPGTNPYTLKEMLASIKATGARQHIKRPVHENPDGGRFYDHKGFNWMLLRNTLTERFKLEKTFSSPITWLTPHAASQVWFILRRR